MVGKDIPLHRLDESRLILLSAAMVQRPLAKGRLYECEKRMLKGRKRSPAAARLSRFQFFGGMK
jgi:hypothetical protein